MNASAHRRHMKHGNFVEGLESRRLLCTLHLPDVAPGTRLPEYVAPQTDGGPEADTGGIVWSNRGTTDNFGVYGARASAARDVVDAAIYFWNKVIISFNQDGGHSQIDLSVTAMARGTGLGGSGGVDTRLGNKPRTSSINLGGGADINGINGVEDAEGFYIDPTPYDYSEFQGPIVNAFTGTATPGGAAAGLADLFSLVTIEIQHALGIDDRYTDLAWRQDPNDYLKVTNVSDTLDNPGKLWTFRSPNLTALFTSNNGGSGGQDRNYAVHTGRVGNSVTVNSITYNGQDDTGTTGGFGNKRYLPSYVGVRALADMYGYTVNPPQDVIGTFYTIPDSANRRVLVRNPDPTSSDVMEMRSSSGGIYITLNIGNDVVGTNMDGYFVVQFSRLAYDSVIMDGGGGTDYLRVDGNDFAPVTLRGNAGDDYLDLGFVQRNLDLINGSVVAEGGSGFDRIFIYDNLDTTGDTFVFGDTPGGGTFDVTGGFNVMYYSGCEEINPTTGSGSDVINVYGTPAGCKMHINSVGGGETVNIGMGESGVGAQDIDGDIHIENTPNFTVVNISNYGDSSNRLVNSGTWGGVGNPFGYVAGLTGGTVFYKYADVSAINCYMGTGWDTLNVFETFRPIGFYNYGGEDEITLGNSVNGTSGIIGNIQFNTADFVINNMTVDNRAGVGRIATLAPSGSNFVLSGMTGGGLITYRNTLFLQLKGSNGNDQFLLNNVNDDSITIDAGGGFDFVQIDDRSHASAPYLTELSANGIQRWVNPGVFAFPYSVGFSNHESFTFYAHSNATSTYIYGTPDTIPFGQQGTVFLGNNADTVVMYPINANQDMTIQSAIGIVGGGGIDSFTVDAVGTTRALGYQFINPFGAGTQNIYGMGPAGMGTAGIESITVNAGEGNDAFSVDQYTSGVALRINGGGGDDACYIGNGDLSANITNIPAFTFDGQDGADGFVVSNSLTTTSWNYQTFVNAVDLYRHSTGYFIHMVTFNIEGQYLWAGSATDIFYVDHIAPGVYTEMSGGAGLDGLALGQLSGSLENVRGPMVYYAGVDGGNIGVTDTADTSADVVHQDANSLGYYPGDSLFGPGGSLRFFDLVNYGVYAGITLNLGSGADTVYAQPLATARVTINAGNPVAAPGDTLNLALAAAQSPVVAGGSSGNVSSANFQTLDWTGIEEPISEDAVAPEVVAADINLDGVPGLLRNGNQQSVDVQFSEDVSALISNGWIELQNLTTGEYVPTGYIAVDYDSVTNTAHFTFPGYPNGVLPDGDYHGRIFAGLTDFFGNALPADAPFDFFFLNGDFNHDRTVDITDLGILATNWQGSGKTFAEGDTNYDGTVDITDLGILATNWQASVPMPSLESMLRRIATGPRIGGERAIDQIEEL